MRKSAESRRDGPTIVHGLAIPALVAVGLLNYLDRALPSVLAESIKGDLALSDTALGLINGFGFLLVYAIAGIPIARVADRGRQASVIAGVLGAWSAMTLVGGLVVSGWQLAMTRMGVALGEAGSLPASHAYLSRRYPPDRRTRALSMLSLAVPLGSSIGLMAGGALGRLIGWRGTLVTMGVVGLVLAPVVYIVLARVGGAPSSGSRIERAATGPTGQLSDVTDRTRLALVLAGSSLVAIGGYAASAFVPAFLMRVHGLALQDMGIRYGLGAGIAGVAALLLTGWLSDRCVARGAKSPLMVVVAMILTVVPLSTAAFLVADPDLALMLAIAGSVVPVAYLAPIVATLHRLVEESRRAQVSALLLFCTALIGGLGPLSVGLVSDALRATRGPAGLGTAMLVIPAAYALAGFVFWLAARRDGPPIR